MQNYQPNAFVFSSKYRLWRHILFWLLQTVLIALSWKGFSKVFPQTLLVMSTWIPVSILFCYPFMYWVIPQFLLKEKYVGFGAMVLIWLTTGLLINYYFRLYVFIPLRNVMGFTDMSRNPGQQGSFFTLVATWCFLSTLVLFKHWFRKQREWMQAEKEKVTAELQLLKAQVHPHFLFNTLNNIYSFSLTNSPKTPELIVKLSSLLSYMLYDCKADQVLLEKEVEVMKDYVDLERERYGNKLEVSWHIEGDIQGKQIVPLILLPFLENAFKHGTSEQLEKPWLSFDLTVKNDTVRCKIANSKNEFDPVSKHGIGVENVKKRLGILYPTQHELKINDEGDFFVVSLALELIANKDKQGPPSFVIKPTPAKAAI
jgi:two-component system, LytTR family, sensor histidine kinase AlgZ